MIFDKMLDDPAASATSMTLASGCVGPPALESPTCCRTDAVRQRGHSLSH